MSRNCRGAGTEDRQWVAERRSPLLGEPAQVVTHAPVSIRMRDGVMLSATIYRPGGAEAQPGILISCGYGADADAFFAETSTLLARRGYVVLFAKLRGVAPSEGNAGLYERFGSDSYDLIEWLARLPECNGQVGMFGASLVGLVQYLAAKESPPSLKVLLPDDAGSDNYWYLWYPGGMNVGPGRAARQSVSGAEKEYSSAIDHRNYDAFWRERTVQPQDLEALARRGIPVFLTSGWDSYLLGSIKSYEWLKAGAPGSRLKMFIGPWGHGAFMSPQPPLLGPGVLPCSGFDYAVLWLDRWLKGIANGVDEEPPVLLYVQGPDEWRFEEDWPLSDEQRVRLYLRARPSGTGVAGINGTMSNLPPQNDAPVIFQYSPDGPYNVAAVTAVSRPKIDKTPYEQHGLVWTSAPLAVPTEMTGYPRITFWASLSSTDADFVVEVTDVGAHNESGLQSLQVTRGYLNAMRYFSRSDPQPLVPGRVYRFELELYPSSYVFAAGHRIRVTLQGAAFDPLMKSGSLALPNIPGVDPNLLTLVIPQGPALNSQTFKVSVLQDAGHPSFIDVPIIGAGTLRFLDGV